MLSPGTVNLAMLLVAATNLQGHDDTDSIEGAYAAVARHPGHDGRVVVRDRTARLGPGLDLGGRLRRGHDHAGTAAPQLSRCCCAGWSRSSPRWSILAIGVDPSRALVLSQVVLSFGIPFALIPLVRLTSDRDADGRRRQPSHHHRSRVGGRRDHQPAQHGADLSDSAGLNAGTPAHLLRVRVEPVRTPDGAALPDATDPRPAMLGDHDWLINERGVATVEPLAGTPKCTGCSGRSSDDDLATLDSAEGVPVRYRRDRLTVHTDDGPSPMPGCTSTTGSTPGPPRPGYLPTDHRRCRSPRAAAALDRLPAPLGSRELAAPGCAVRDWAAITFGIADRARGDRGQPIAVTLRLPGDPRRRTGADDRRDRRTRRRRRGRVVVRGAPSRPIPASPAVRAVRSRRVGAARRISRPRRRRGLAARLRPHRARAPNCWPGAATARWPRIWRRHVRCPAIRSSPIWTPFRANCAACIRTTRSTGCARAGRSWNYRFGSGGSARAVRCPALTACRRSPRLVHGSGGGGPFLVVVFLVV